jgi:hypothetical protein
MLGAASRFVLVAGAFWSLLCTIYAGRHNPSVLLAALFVLWVLSPFAGFAMVIRSARRHHVGIMRALLANSIVVTLTAVVIYSAVAFSPPSHHTAFAFLVVPAATWLAIGTFAAAAKFARRP